jgi:hypothetical protein
MPLRLLFISDYGAHGLYGQPQDLRTKSVMFRAIYYMGGSQKSRSMPSAGGSFGFGKSAFIRGSRVRTIFAHSVFQPYKGMPNETDLETERLLGFCWWNEHEVDGITYDGRGQFAEEEGSGTAQARRVPFSGSAARKLAIKLGMPVRSPDDPAELGTTLALLDPAVTASELAEAVERWWWPALQEGLFEIDIVDEFGATQVVDPGSNASLKPFLQAFDLASGRRPILNPGIETVREFNRLEGKEIGTLALTAPLNISSGSDEVSSEESTQARVALIRGPRMVTTYAGFPRHRVPIAGVFVAAADADPLLRQTEPMSHDHWSDVTDDQISLEATEMANAVGARVRRYVRDFANAINPPVQRNDVHLSAYGDALVKLSQRHSGPGTPPKLGPSPVDFRYTNGPAVIDCGEGAVRMAASLAAFCNESEPVQVSISFEFVIIENNSDRVGSTWSLRSTLDSSKEKFEWDEENELWVGWLSDKEVNFAVETHPYDGSWSGRLTPRVQLVQSSGSVIGGPN